MLKLHKLDGERFRSFVEPFNIQFPSRGLTLIRGLNKTTGDSSAAGKSSLILAIQHLLGGAPFPATELQSWYAEKSFSIGLELNSDNVPFRIERGTGLKVWTNGELVKGGAKAGEAAIDNLFGLDAKLRTAVTYRPQRRPGMFLNLTASEKSQFLAKLLNLDLYEHEAKLATNRANELTKNVLAAKTNVETYSEIAYQHRNQLETLSNLGLLDNLIAIQKRREFDVVEILPKITLELKEHLGHLAEIEQEIEQEIVAETNKLHQTAIIQPDQQYLKTTEQNLTKLDNSIYEISLAEKIRATEFNNQKLAFTKLIASKTHHQKELDRLKNQFKELIRQIDILESAICYTCNQPWITDSAQANLETLRQNKESIRSKVLEIQAALKNISSTEQSLKELTWEPNPQISLLEDTRSKIEKELNDYRNQILAKQAAATRELSQKETAAKVMVEQKYWDKKLEHHSRIKTLEAAKEKHQTELYEIKNKLNKLEMDRNQRVSKESDLDSAASKLTEYTSKLNKLTDEVSAELDFAGLVGRDGFLGVIFDEILDEITERTNGILEQVSNVRHVSLEFGSENETQSGTIQKKITPKISINGHEASLEAGASGGMYTSIELAVDLAVGDVISRRRGKALPGWLILDEAFNGLGHKSKETALEVLSGHSGDRLILVVDHTSETIGSYDKVIDVICENDRSMIL